MINAQGISPKEILHFQLTRDVTSLYKHYLNALEDLRVEHLEMMKKIANMVSEDKLSALLASDYFTDVKFKHCRKRILDSGNAAIRSIGEQLENFTVIFNSK